MIFGILQEKRTARLGLKKIFYKLKNMIL